MATAVDDEPGPVDASEPDEPSEAEVPPPGAADQLAPEDDVDPWAAPPHGDDEPVIHRNPPRDWAAPPPWATSGAAGMSTAGGPGGGRPDDQAPEFVAGRDPARGLAGSAADRLATGSPASSPASRGASSSPASMPSDELAGLVAGAAVSSARARAPEPITRPPTGAYPTTTASGRRPTVSSTRTRAQQHDGPSWESAKRYEAYPTIKTRAGLPGIPRIAVWAGALIVAAMGLFFLPALLGIGGGGTGPSALPSRSAAVATATPAPTPIPEPTAQTYVIKAGDTLTKIAKKFDVTVDELLAANKKTIKNKDRITVGLEIVIPVPTPDEVTDPSAAAPEASPTPEP